MASLALALLRRIRWAGRQTARRMAGARRRLALAAGLLGVPLAGAAGALTPSFVSPFLIPVVVWPGARAFADIDGDGDAFVGEYFGNTTLVENVELGPGTCTDGRDNGFDGRIDSPSDPGCADAPDPNERSTKQCDNGVDDDNDGKIDWRGDATGRPAVRQLDRQQRGAAAAQAPGLRPRPRAAAARPAPRSDSSALTPPRTER
jgi:hypothetical protein